MMRKHHAYLFSHLPWSKKFWTAGYFYQTVGTITAASVKEYIEKGQRKHWVKPMSQQKTLFNYAQ